MQKMERYRIPVAYGAAKRVRQALFRRGLRYQLDDQEKVGYPHIVFPKHRTLLFVCGCSGSWHGCERLYEWRHYVMVAQNGPHRRRLLDSILATHRFRNWKAEAWWECELTDSERIDAHIDRLFGPVDASDIGSEP